jgi:hypothetical protein
VTASTTDGSNTDGSSADGLSVDGALFVVEGDRLLPTELARGPWSPEALHGGPVAALVARAVESVAPDAPMHVARLTVELLRPVPVAPLSVSATTTRPGRKVQVLDVRVATDETDVAWGRALRIRRRDPGPIEEAPAADEPVPGQRGAPPRPETAPRPAALAGGYRGFHNTGAELRFVVGSFDRRGPATVWVRLQVPVVPGEEPTPLQRVAAAADFGNGVSSILDFTRYAFVNPDLSVHLERPAIGEWVCLEASTRLGVPGVGLARCALWDTAGLIGHSLQSLVIEARA